MHGDTPLGLLVIVELGAAWPGSLVEGSTHAKRRVLCELEGEGPSAFAARAIRAASTLMPRGVRLDHSVLAVNERADEAQMCARRELARALLYPRDRRRARLSIVATPTAGERLRGALLSLAQGVGAVKGARDRLGISFGGRAEEPVSSPMPEAGEAGVAAVA
jgi:hypothetical protein